MDYQELNNLEQGYQDGIDQEEGVNDIFVELAKAKSDPVKIAIDSAASAPDEEPSRETRIVPTAEDDNEIADDEAEGRLTVDVYQDGDDIVVQSAVAGVDVNDIDIHITNESVTVKGEREKTHAIEEKDYFYQECFWGKFSRSVILPTEVDPDKSSATVKNGVLTIRMPKLNRQKTKKLKVKEG